MNTPNLAASSSATLASQPIENALHEMWTGFKTLLAQQLEELQIVSATFDYGQFSGECGALSGAQSL